MYSTYGAAGSTLIVVPFNQGSKQDIEALVDNIYDLKSGLGWDLDAIIPLAAIPENGNGIDNIDSRSELAHRIMLTNLLLPLERSANPRVTETTKPFSRDALAQGLCIRKESLKNHIAYKTTNVKGQ